MSLENLLKLVSVCTGQAASDMWAVGALAWELLTGRPLCGDSFSDEDVMMALLGFKPLPFEADPSLWVLFTESQVLSFPIQPHRVIT